MRIAYLNGEDLTKTGGGGVHFRAVSEELARSDNQVFVVAPQYTSKPWVSFESKAVNTLKIRVPGKNICGVLCFGLFLFVMLPWFKLKYKWDALMARGGGPSVFYALIFLYARILGMRAVLECNGVSWAEFESRGFSKVFCKLVKLSAWSQAKAASAIIGVTPEICQAYCTLAGRTAKDSYPISNGVFTEKFPLDQRQSIRKKYGWDDSETVFVMPSGFTPWHGLHELVEAMTLLPPEIKEKVRFVLPGDGKLYANIKDFVIRHGLENYVELPGSLSREEIYCLLSAADVGLLLRPEAEKSKYPGSPLKLFEYFGAGLPAVTCADSYHESLIPYYSLGVVLESMNSSTLARAIAEMANAKKYEYDRENIVRVANEEFHWSKVAQRVLAVLQGTEPVLENWITHNSDLQQK